MKKINLLIAALHAGALALTTAPGTARAQDAQEIQAYMQALSVGTAEAMAQFLTAYPNSSLPGSELGASIAAGIGPATAAIGAPAGRAGETGRRDSDSDRISGRLGSSDDGIY
jgi:hypothetical protein